MEEETAKKEKVIKNDLSKCKNCGGNLRFSPYDQSLKCDNCGSLYEIPKSKEYKKHDINEKYDDSKEYKAWINNNKIFKCSNCGSSVILNSLEISKCCPYCGNAFVSANGEIPGYLPDSIIPFRFDNSTASEKFVQNVRKKFYVSGKFKKKLPENKIIGTYIPTFSFDAISNSDYNGVLTKTETYQTNNGIATRTVSFNVSGHIQVNHKDVIIESSSKLTQANIKGILPYDTNGAFAFRDDYIRGYTVEHYQDALDICEKTAEQTFREQIKRGIMQRYPQATGIQSLNFNPIISNEKYQYQIVPIFEFQYLYKNKDYNTYMNGQTGKVDNNLPKSIPKIVATVILALLIILLPIVISLLSNS